MPTAAVAPERQLGLRLLRQVAPPDYDALPEGTALRPGERLTFRDREVLVAEAPHCDNDIPVLIDCANRTRYCLVHGEIP